MSGSEAGRSTSWVRRVLALSLVAGGGGAIVEHVSSQLASVPFEVSHAIFHGAVYLLWWSLLDRSYRRGGYGWWRVLAAGALPVWVLISLPDGVTQLDWLAWYSQWWVLPAAGLDGAAWLLRGTRPEPVPERRNGGFLSVITRFVLAAALLPVSWCAVYLVQAVRAVLGGGAAPF